jgi:hypothetical protein
MFFDRLFHQNTSTVLTLLFSTFKQIVLSLQHSAVKSVKMRSASPSSLKFIVCLLILVGRNSGEGERGEDEKITEDELVGATFQSSENLNAEEANTFKRTKAVSAETSTNVIPSSASPTKSETADDDESSFKITNAIPSMFEIAKTVSLGKLWRAHALRLYGT